jgi:hypothetical protein
VAAPVAQRRIRLAVNDIVEAAEALSVTLNQIVEAGQELGLIEKPRRRPVTPYVLAGVAIGAGAAYLIGGRRALAPAAAT